MKADIHPDYVVSKVHCSCGNTFETRSTLPEIKVEVCSVCHPFYTGKQKLIDTGGRVERFNKKFRQAQKDEVGRVSAADSGSRCCSIRPAPTARSRRRGGSATPR